MNATDPRSTGAARGFTLAEMLLAIFILGIGVISIAALFPAGIALQRQATDDTIGPIVAKNAFATIRAKLSQEDFGSFQDFGLAAQYVAGQGPAGTIRPVGGTADIPQLSGDWGWMRPGFYTNATAAGETNLGTIDVFSANFTRLQAPFNLGARLTPPGPWATEMFSGVNVGGTTVPIFGIPYNRAKFPLYDIAAADPTAVPGNLDLQALLEPNFTFTQAERSYPQGASVSGTLPVYHWECMFRRSAGRVQVAVFVYRVTAPGGETRPYRTGGLTTALLTGAGQPAAPGGSFDTATTTPPIPALYLAPAAVAGSIPWPLRGNPTGAFTAANGYTIGAAGVPAPADEIFGTHRGTPFATALIWDDWQLPNSWWVDNHGNVHKVLNGRTRQGPTAAAAANEPGQGPVKLQRPIPIMPSAPVNGVIPGVAYPSGGPNQYLSGIWYVPQRDARGNILTPIFAAVEEL